MSYTSEVASWIESNTKSSLPSDVMGNSNSRFFTQRNSKQTALRWRETIQMANVEAVQTLCAQEMAKLGYLQIHDQVYNESNVIADFAL